MDGPNLTNHRYFTYDQAQVTTNSHLVSPGTQPNGGEEAQVVRSWLDWRLKGDAVAARIFQGSDCTLCRDPSWTVNRKGL